jgi:hypothetical protein
MFRVTFLPDMPVMASNEVIIWSISLLVNLALIVGSCISFRFISKYLTNGPIVVPFVGQKINEIQWGNWKS